MDLGALRCAMLRFLQGLKLGHRKAGFEGESLQTCIVVSRGHGKGGDSIINMCWNISIIYHYYISLICH